MTAELTIVSSNSPDFSRSLNALRRRGNTDLERVEPAVRQIILDVAEHGDAAVKRYVEKFEGRQVVDLLIRDYGGKEALESLSPRLQGALRLAADRIRRYHSRQAEQLKTFEYEEEGVTL